MPDLQANAASQHLRPATAAPSQEQLQRQLEELVAETTGAALHSMDQPLMEAGVDSIGAVELRCVECGMHAGAPGCALPSGCVHLRPPPCPRMNAITERWGVEAPPTLMFDHPSIAALAAWLTSQLAVSSGAAAGPDAVALRSEALALREPAQHDAPLVALAGVACRFPSTIDAAGAGTSLAGFWAQAAAGADVQALLPLSKWDAGEGPWHSVQLPAVALLPHSLCPACHPSADALYNPDQTAAAGGTQTIYTRFAATLDGIPGSSGCGIAAFDADAFRLTRAEAAMMDPHGRLLLEHAAEAAADAAGRLQGRAAAAPLGAATGVYVGCMWSSEYVELLPALGAPDTGASVSTGNTFPFMAGRVSYTYGFQVGWEGWRLGWAGLRAAYRSASRCWPSDHCALALHPPSSTAGPLCHH